MTVEWRDTTIGALVAATNGELQTGPFGSQLHAHDYVVDGPVPVVPTSAIGRRRIDGTDVPRIGLETAARLRRHQLKAGDILFARRGVQAAGLSALVGEDQAGWICGTGAIRLRLSGNIVDPGFLSFALSSEATYVWIRQHAIGATMPNLNESVVRGIPVRMPPFDEQRRIAAVLGALDDKIELNRQMNRTLEEMIQTLFRSWFIDFDGQTDLMDSAVGLIPSGWSVKAIGDVVRVVGGSTPSTKESQFWESGSIAWATPKDLSGVVEPVLLDTERRITKRGLSTIGSGLLPEGTLLLSSRAPIGYTAIAQLPIAVNQGFIALPPGGELPPSYLLFWVRHNMEVIKGRAGGTTFAEISKSAFRPIPVVVPPPARIAKFQGVADVLLAKIAHNARQSRTLTVLRDLLLPRLISGQLRVPESLDQALEALSAEAAP